ncbi:MAG: hypothetical protein ACLP01_25450 [Solirubrobacteraceae bacterium]
MDTDTLDGFLADSTTTRLSFEMIDIDRSFLSDTLAQFAEILDAFPCPQRHHRRLSPGSPSSQTVGFPRSKLGPS